MKTLLLFIAVLLLAVAPTGAPRGAVLRPIQIGVTESFCANTDASNKVRLRPRLVAYDNDDKMLLVASGSADIIGDVIASGVCRRIATLPNLINLVYIQRHKFVVSYDGGDRLAIINAESGSILPLGGQITGFFITGLAYDHAGSKLYIYGTDGRVRVMSIPSGSVSSPLRVPASEAGGSLAIDSSSNVLYCFDWAENSVASIDGESKKIVLHSLLYGDTQSPLFLRAKDIAFDGYARQLLLASGDAVLRLTLDGRVVGVLSMPEWLLPSNGVAPLSIAPNSSGTIVYVADGENIARFDLFPPFLPL